MHNTNAHRLTRQSNSLVRTALLSALLGVAFAQPARAGGGSSGKQPIITNVTATAASWCVGDLVSFHVDAHDPDGYIVQYEWNFQDGSAWVSGGADIQWAFARQKQYNVGVRVTDNEGKKSVEHIKVNITCGGESGGGGSGGNMPPTVVLINPPEQTTAGAVVSFTASATDPDGTIVSYVWDFGDGRTATGPVVSNIYAAQADAYVVIVTVTDDQGATASAATSIEVLGAPGPPAQAFVNGAQLTIRVSPFTGKIEVQS